jgi:hypothetical protein
VLVSAYVLAAAGGRLLMVITGRPGGWLPVGWPVTVFDLAALTDEQTKNILRVGKSLFSRESRRVVHCRI